MFRLTSINIGILKPLITNLTIVSTHYMPELCAKTQIMRPNYMLKYKLCTKIMHDVLCVKSQIMP